MRKSQGFTLIELIVFIVVLSIGSITLLMALTTVLNGSSVSHNQATATQTAAQCIEWYLAKRVTSASGYTNITTGTFPGGSFPSSCTAPTGFSISTSVVNTTIGGDANYKTITSTVTAGGVRAAELSLLIGSY